MLSLKERIFLNILVLVFIWGGLAIFSIYKGTELPGDWIYKAATTKNLSFIQAWRDDFDKAIKISKEFQKNGK